MSWYYYGKGGKKYLSKSSESKVKKTRINDGDGSYYAYVFGKNIVYKEKSTPKKTTAKKTATKKVSSCAKKVAAIRKILRSK